MTRRVAAIAGAMLLTACNQSPEGTSTGSRTPSASQAKSKPAVIASFYPLYEFARQVAGDRAEVTAMVPPGVEPHDWEPAPQDVGRLEKAQVFIYNGAGFEPWADKLLANLGGRRPSVIVATQGMELLRSDLPGHDRGPSHGHLAAAQSEQPRAGNGAATEHDPHVWLDPVLAQQQVETIRVALAQADPESAEDYASGARTFTERLRVLGEQYERGLSRCDRREIVVSHASFAYLARRYRLTQVPVMGLSPDSEPSPARLAQIVRFARRHQVRFIFFETLVSPKLAETLAREVGAQTSVLNPVEGLTPADQAAGRGYVELMEDNLKNLRMALGCA